MNILVREYRCLGGTETDNPVVPELRCKTVRNAPESNPGF